MDENAPYYKNHHHKKYSDLLNEKYYELKKPIVSHKHIVPEGDLPVKMVEQAKPNWETVSNRIVREERILAFIKGQK